MESKEKRFIIYRARPPVTNDVSLSIIYFLFVLFQKMSTEPGVLQVRQPPSVLQEQVRGRHHVRRGQIYIV